ncbi:amino acid permease [Polynucleobacter sp. Ross1-W9]|uniref:amino acid permease n=1 Tax=Polynucleobacter parvulilacunae TaxID=1855631 RepID=UPI001C0AE534|nr:amino acid permease [Polynucleobacter parvulilacunae]MBU3556213.1 amino acid permease [Polynucleobacter parvulilacunae]
MTLKRTLKARHIRIMALGSTIGVGLFLGSATSIKLAGPSIILAYAITGLITFIVARALGEMTVRQPISGSFAVYARNYIGPLAGYLVGWTYLAYWIALIIAEVTAVGIYMNLWFPDSPQWVWACMSILVMSTINLAAVKFFGEFEFWFAIIKIVAILAMIALGAAVIIFGFTNNWEPIGLKNLWIHGGFFPNGLYGFASSLQLALFSYLGVEMIGLTAGEAEDPERTIPKAIDSLLYRIFFFYVGAIFVILAIFPWHEISNIGSPFVAMLERLDLKNAAGILNFVVITAALSSCNAGIYSGARLLYGQSLSGSTNKYFSKISINGIPVRAIIFTAIICLFGVSINFFVPNKAFEYLMSSNALLGLIVWFFIIWSQINFRRSLSTSEAGNLKYKTPLWPISSYLALMFMAAVLVIMGINEESRIFILYALILILIFTAWFYAFEYRRASGNNTKDEWRIK